MEDKMLVALALGLPVLVVVLSKLISSAVKPRPNLPPGPWTLPVIGSIHHLARNPNTHRALRSLSEKHGPLMQLWLGEVPAVVASTPEAAQEILRNQDVKFSDRNVSTTVAAISFNASDIFFSPYSERWRHLRRIFTQELLTTPRVRSFQGIREDEVGRLLRQVAASADAGVPVNLTDRIGELVNDIVVRCSIGSRCKYRDEFLDAMNTVKTQLVWLTLGDLFPSSKLARMLSSAPRKGLASRKTMERIIGEIVEEHKDQMDDPAQAAGKDSFVDVLIRLQKEGGTPIPITNEVIVVLLFDMFSGGGETSSTVLVWIMAELMRSPRVMAKVQAEVRQALQGKATVTEDDIAGLKYLKMVIKETLRLHSPAPLLVPHRCREACKVMGYDVLEGSCVFVNVWAMGRDPKYWEDAEEFKPERFQNTDIDYKGNDFMFLPFGAGRRICPGINLGVANMELPLASLLYHFDWKLPNQMAPKDLDMQETPGMVAAKLTNLDIIPVTHVAPPASA
ncbi:ent-isokaurene C2/C3-hydroxylase-like [Oryza brachyantha]|uniref:ent-isokaurene C2/C3-hydroxylase-like n=1 Tax=Oryza brachyantha TaxID=4533 RepID=UPI001ADA16FB|nr:ent-isokaurene C2/C3-hydroxylase-like [Oryza brachyantha]